MSSILEVRALRKNYKNTEAVKGIDFSVKDGSFFSLLGENGAGKSTTINIIATLLKKSSGEVIVAGNRVDRDDSKIRRDIGVVFQGNMLDKHLTVQENITNRGMAYGLKKQDIKARIDELAPKIGISELLNRYYGKLSGGQKRRADIARALIHSPKILILDEPTTGLDPYTRKCVWETIQQLKEKNNLTIFLTTHYMEEAAASDHIVILDKGEIKASGTPEELRLKYSTDKLILVSRDTDTLAQTLAGKRVRFERDRNRVVVRLANSFDSIAILKEVKPMIEGFEVIRGNMDDVFVNITGSNKEAAV